MSVAANYCQSLLRRFPRLSSTKLASSTPEFCVDQDNESAEPFSLITSTLPESMVLFLFVILLVAGIRSGEWANERLSEEGKEGEEAAIAAAAAAAFL